MVNMLDANSKLIVKRIGGFLAAFLSFTMVLNINFRDFKRKRLTNFKRSKIGLLRRVPRIISALTLNSSAISQSMVT